MRAELVEFPGGEEQLLDRLDQRHHRCSNVLVEGRRANASDEHFDLALGHW